MVDIHSHILPGIDDGAKTIEDSLGMLKIAIDSGTTDIVATPHANSTYPFDGPEVSRLISELTASVGETIRIHRGCDLHLNFENLTDALDNPGKYTVNGGRYLMVELPDMASLPVMRTVLDRLLNMRLVPVITHPERNAPLCAHLDELEGWVRDGCLTQITALSFSGRFGSQAQRVAERLVNSNMVHFVASDSHDCSDRTPNLAPAFKLVSDRWGAETAEMLFTENPAAVVLDEPIFAAAPIAKKKSIFSFWK